MDPLERGARLIVWLIAGTFVLWTVMELTLYLFVCYQKHLPVEIFSCVLKSVPLLIGIVLFAKTTSIVAWITDKLE